MERHGEHCVWQNGECQEVRQCSCLWVTYNLISEETAYANWAEGNKETCPTVLESLKNKDWTVKEEQLFKGLYVTGWKWRVMPSWEEKLTSALWWPGKQNVALEDRLVCGGTEWTQEGHTWAYQPLVFLFFLKGTIKCTFTLQEWNKTVNCKAVRVRSDTD